MTVNVSCWTGMGRVAIGPTRAAVWESALCPCFLVSTPVSDGGPTYRFVYVDQQGYERNPPQTFASLAASFTGFQKD